MRKPYLWVDFGEFSTKYNRQIMGNRIVYSTNPNFNTNSDPDEEPTLQPSAQQLKALISKKGRGGKTVTIIDGFRGSSHDLNELGKTIKTKCGIGGSVKDGQILLQGDVREKAMHFLRTAGYNIKKAGG